MNCEIYNHTTPGPHGQGQISKKANFTKIFSTPTYGRKNLMRCYDDYEALYQSCEIHGPGLWVHVLGRGQYGHIVKIY